MRNGKQTGVSVPGRQQRGDKYKKRSVNDIAIPDNALEMVEAEIMEDFAGNNGSTTAQSSGGNVYPVGTTEADYGTQEPILEIIDTQLVSSGIKVASVEETVGMMQITSVLEPVLMSDASRRRTPSQADIPTSAPSSEAGTTTADTDKGEPRISENFTCAADTTGGMMDKGYEEASQTRNKPLPGVSISVDTVTSIEAGTGLCLTQAGVGGGGGEARVTGEGDTRSLTIRGCQHDRRGYCTIHGMMAVMK